MLVILNDKQLEQIKIWRARVVNEKMKIFGGSSVMKARLRLHLPPLACHKDQ